MNSLKLMEWNMEWMNDLFVSGTKTAQFRPDDEKPQHNKKCTVKERRRDLSGVINELGPDIESRNIECQAYTYDNVKNVGLTPWGRKRGQAGF